MSKSSEEAKEPRFRLIYYHFRGRAELIRLIFEHLEIPYIDQRISFEEWAERKPGAWNQTYQKFAIYIYMHIYPMVFLCKGLIVYLVCLQSRHLE